MRRFRLQTQLTIVALFLAIYAAAVGLSFMVQNDAQASLEEAFHKDLSVLTRLPRLSDELRNLDLLTNEYLLTGNAAWLKERRRQIREIRGIQNELTGLLSGAREERIWNELDRSLAGYLAQQDQWIGLRDEGRLPADSAARLAAAQSQKFDRLLDLVMDMRDQNFLQLKQRWNSTREAARAAFFVILGAGALVGALLVVFLTLYVIRPLNALQSYARSWHLGQEWDLARPATGPEIESLFENLRDMAGRLNQQYSKEQDLARFKTQLVSLVSHEFNNALSVINGVSVLLEDSEGSPSREKRDNYYQMLKANIRTLHIAANNLLNMGQLDSGKFAISPRKTQLGKLLHQCLQRLEILSLRKGIHVLLELPEEEPAVKADPEALSLVATNLLSNAIKYTPDNGRITVKLEREGRKTKLVRVTFEDNGIGISPEDQKMIFSGFYRTQQGKSKAKGFGVGLSLARRIVEAHDADLTVESQPGKGSRFSFALPVYEGD